MKFTRSPVVSGFRHAVSRCVSRPVAACAFATAVIPVVAASADPAYVREAMVAPGAVRLRDVADLSRLPSPWREQAAGLVIANMPQHRRSIDLPVSTVARRVRTRMPGLTPWFGPTTAGPSIHLVGSMPEALLRPTATRTADEQPCMRIIGPLTRGTALRADDVDATAVACNGQTLRRVRYDADAHVVRAVDDLAQGDVIRAVPTDSLARVRRGETITAAVSVGNITVSHNETALVDRPVRRAEAAVPARQPMGAAP